MTTRQIEIAFHVLVGLMLAGALFLLIVSGCAAENRMPIQAEIRPDVLREALKSARIGTVEYRGLGWMEILALSAGGFLLMYAPASVVKDWIRNKWKSRSSK